MSGTFTIGQLAKAAGVNVETIRYYERRGLIVLLEFLYIPPISFDRLLENSITHLSVSLGLEWIDLKSTRQGMLAQVSIQQDFQIETAYNPTPNATVRFQERKFYRPRYWVADKVCKIPHCSTVRWFDTFLLRREFFNQMANHAARRRLVRLLAQRRHSLLVMLRSFC